MGLIDFVDLPARFFVNQMLYVDILL